LNLKVLCYGEVVIDLVPKADGSMVYKVGGAPLNVAVGLRRLGVDTTFVCCVGDDWFGRSAVGYLKSNKIRRYIEAKPGVATRMAVLSHDERKERSFEFSSGIAAENFLPLEKLKDANRLNPDVFYFGSFPFAKGDSLDAFQKFVHDVKKFGTVILFDPNLRLSIFDSPSHARRTLEQLVPLSNIIRLNTEELFFLVNPAGNNGERRQRIERAAATLVKLGPKAIFITDGTGGSYLYANGIMVSCQSFGVKVVDTTGCGDAFTAALVSSYFKKGGDISWSAERILTWANAAGALAATKLGGADSMPTRISIGKFLKLRSRGGDNTKKRVSANKSWKNKSIHFQTKIKREDNLYATS